MAFKRQQHWATRGYHNFLLDRADTKFAWGVHDCALFAADGIQAMTGVDIASDFRGKYSDEPSSIEAIKTVTGVDNPTIEDAAAYCANKHGMAERKYPLMAQRGDLVVVEDSGRLIAGLIHLSGRHIVAAGENGLKRILVTPTNIKRAWKV
jgi:hypothetical protein